MEGLRQVRALAQYHPRTLTKSLHPFCYKISSEVAKSDFCPSPPEDLSSGRC